MFQFQTNADGGVKAFTFYPFNANLVDENTEYRFPHFVDCRLKSDDIIAQPIHLKLSFISKIECLKQDNQFFTIAIVDRENEVYKFVFLKEMFCCDYTGLPMFVVESRDIKPEPQKVKILEQINKFIQAIYNNDSLHLNITKDDNGLDYFCRIKNWINFSLTF